jgi:hypothetical protein
MHLTMMHPLSTPPQIPCRLQELALRVKAEARSHRRGGCYVWQPDGPGRRPPLRFTSVANRRAALCCMHTRGGVCRAS